jgi:hypothetical protein
MPQTIRVRVELLESRLRTLIIPVTVLTTRRPSTDSRLHPTHRRVAWVEPRRSSIATSGTSSPGYRCAQPRLLKQVFGVARGGGLTNQGKLIAACPPLARGRHATALLCARRGWRLHGKKSGSNGGPCRIGGVGWHSLGSAEHSAVGLQSQAGVPAAWQRRVRRGDGSRLEWIVGCPLSGNPPGGAAGFAGMARSYACLCRQEKGKEPSGSNHQGQSRIT